MKKRVIAVLLCAVMLIGLLPQFTVNAEATAIQISDTNIYWEITGNTLTISGTGVMPNYTHYSQQPWHTARSKITSVVIQDGVTEVGVSAFNHLTNLTDVTIPSSVTCIKGEGFMDCPKLSSVVIPSSVKNISYDAFKNCTSLASIILPSTVEFSNTPFDMTGDEKSITLSVGLSGTEWTNNKFTNNIEYGFTTKVPYALYLLPDAVADEQLTGVTPVKNNSNGGIHICGDTYSTTNWKTITANAPSNGTYTVNGESITTAKTLYVGEDTPITLTATPATGYAFGGWTVKDESNQNVAVTNNSFTMPESNVTVTPTFKKLSKVSWTDPANGTISATFGTGNTTITSGATDVTEGETVTVTATPSAGYQLSAVTVNGSSDGVTINGNTATFTMPASDTTVSATMSPIDYTITANAAANGKYSVSKDSTAIYTDVTANQNSYTAAHIGETYTLTATPDTGYSLTSWGVTGAASTNGNSFTVGASNVTIAPTFAQKSHTITAKGVTGGTYTVSVGGNAVYSDVSNDQNTYNTAHYNDSITLAATPAAGYNFGGWTIKDAGNATVEVTDNAFAMPDSSVTITPTFTPIDYTVTQNSAEHGSYTVTKNNETLVGNVHLGDVLTISATADAGYKFNGWTVTGANYQQGSSQDANATIVVGSTDISITPSFVKDSFALTLTGISDGNGNSIAVTVDSNAIADGTTVEYEKTVVLTPTLATGWEIASVSVKKTGDDQTTVPSTCDNNTGVCSFAMPGFAVTVTVSYKKIDYSISEENNYGTIAITEKNVDTTGKVHIGDTFDIVATPNEGYIFYVWQVTGGATIDHPSSATAVLTIGSADVTLTAIYRPTITYANPIRFAGNNDEYADTEDDVPDDFLILNKVTVKISNATFDGFGTSGIAPGTEVQVTTSAGEGFNNYNIIIHIKKLDGSNYFTTTNSSTTFQMPNEPVKIEAEFKPLKHTIAIQTRVDGSDTSIAHISGGGYLKHFATGTLYAPTVDGYDFVGWYQYYGENNKTKITASQNYCYIVDRSYYTKGGVTYTGMGIGDKILLTAVYQLNGSHEVRVNASKYTITNVGANATQRGLQAFTVKGNPEITVTYTDTVNYQFLYWANENNKVLSTDAAYKFTLTTDMDIHAVYTEETVGTGTTHRALVIFKTASGNQILQARTYQTSDDTPPNISYPVAPAGIGRVFEAWVFEDDQTTEATPEAIGQKMASSTCIKIIPKFRDTDDTYTVTVETKRKNGQTLNVFTIHEEDNKPINGGSAALGKGIVLTAKTGFKEIINSVYTTSYFQYWADVRGNILSYSLNYTVYAASDITLYAVYDTVEIAPQNTVNVTGITASGPDGNGKYTVSFTESYNVGKFGCTILKSGFIYTADAEVANNAAMTIDGKYARISFTDKSSVPEEKSGTYQLFALTADPDKVIYVRAFIQYQYVQSSGDNPVTEIITEYSDIVSASYNSYHTVQ